MRWLTILPLLFLSACLGNAMQDAMSRPSPKSHSSPSAGSIVAIALRESRMFGQNIADPEADAVALSNPNANPVFGNVSANTGGWV